MRLPKPNTPVIVITANKSNKSNKLKVEPTLAYVTKKGQWVYDTSILEAYTKEQLPPVYVENPNVTVVKWRSLPTP